MDITSLLGSLSKKFNLPSSQTLLGNAGDKLTKVMFKAGASDVTAVPDVYKVNSNNTLNTLVGKFTDFDGSGIISSLTSSGSGFLSEITKSAPALIQSYARDGSTSNLTSRLGAVAGQSLATLDGSLQGTIANALGTNTDVNAGMSALISGTVQTFKSGTFKNFSNIANLTNELSGVSDLIQANDTTAVSAVASAALSGLISYGIDTGISTLVTRLSTKDPASLKAALSYNVKTAIQNSNLTAIQACITHLGVGGVLNQDPTAVADLFKYYTIPTGTTDAQYATLCQSFLAIVIQLAPNWDVDVRNGQNTVSLTYFTAASKDCLTLLKTDSKYLIPATLAGKYSNLGDYVTQLKKEYPNMMTL